VLASKADRTNRRELGAPFSPALGGAPVAGGGGEETRVLNTDALTLRHSACENISSVALGGAQGMRGGRGRFFAPGPPESHSSKNGRVLCCSRPPGSKL
jgi:hypothetical protein